MDFKFQVVLSGLSGGAFSWRPFLLPVRWGLSVEVAGIMLFMMNACRFSGNALPKVSLMLFFLRVSFSVEGCYSAFYSKMKEKTANRI